MPYVVGLTGGIASGKSTASVYLQTLGITVVDADIISRKLTAKNGQAIDAIRATFGEAYIDNGALNRARMRELVFHDKDALAQLESILHPMIHQAITDQLASAKSPYVILDSALLVEKEQWRQAVNLLVVIDAAPEEQIRRLIQTRGLSRETSEAILANQASRDTRLRYADIVIENNSDTQRFRELLLACHKKILSIIEKDKTL